MYQQIFAYKRSGFLLIFLFLVFGCGTQKGFRELKDGIIVSIENPESPAKAIRLQVKSERIIRVSATPEKQFPDKESLMISDTGPTSAKWDVHKSDSNIILTTSALRAVVSLTTGNVSFQDSLGNILLAEDNRDFGPVTVEGKSAFRLYQGFDNINNDNLYGLGGNQLGMVNLAGEDLLLKQRNSEVFVPLLVSSGGYGILWDNASITNYGDSSAWKQMEALHLFDSEGNEGHLTAEYYSRDSIGKKYKSTRQENSIDYSFLKDLDRFKENFNSNYPEQAEWNGFISSDSSGEHSFRSYSGGYIKIWIGNKLLLDRWRQAWNPTENLLKVSMEKDKKYPIKIQWLPDGGESYFSLTWKAPKTEAQKNEIALTSEMGDFIDYYFIAGKNMDQVISGYRQLTGKAPVMPLWAYGFWQSRERYKTQKELMDVVKEFRERKIPLDNIVQDWQFWEEDQWGSQKFDLSRFPDPEGMIKDLHEKYNTRFMISVWPKFYTRTPVFKDFWDKGWLYKQNVLDSTRDWVGPGYVSTFYDAFNKDARKAFWNLLDKNLFSMGVDAWWLDATEPDILSNSSVERHKKLMGPTALGSSTEFFNAYPLEQSKAIYEGQRSSNPDQRVFILTRSAFAGSQRYAAATWSGDIGATWRDMKDQIATGVSFSLTGIPYWTVDIGGFATENRYSTLDEKSMPEWQEQMTRWFQFGAFCPLFRSHGQYPYREIFNVAPTGSPAYKSMVYYDKLRYRLMPYIYSLGGAIYLDDYTIMRGLAMDFPKDATAANITDQYLFGPSLLINPVYTFGAKSRSVYLPEGVTWFDLYSGKSYPGGQTINTNAPYERMPVFVRSGSIIPFGPEIQYTGEKPADTLILNVYTGSDGQFNIYEDDGKSYQYEQDSYSLIPLSYNEANRTLTIGKRKGSFAGMLDDRVFIINWISPEKAAPLSFETSQGKVVAYDGGEVVVKAVD